MLVMAMKDHEGEVIGVLQLLNALTNTHLLTRMKSDLEEIRRLRDNECELGEKLRDAYVKEEHTNEPLQAALDKAWTLRLAGALFLVLLLGIGGLSYARGNQDFLPDLKALIASRTTAGLASPTVNVPTVGVEGKPVSTAMTLLGRIEPIQQVTVASPFQGKIIGEHFTCGQRGDRGEAARHPFLIESLLLCFVGGILGIGLGIRIGGAWGVAKYQGWLFITSPGAVWLGFGVSALVGVLFGYYPAHQASRLRIIEALRSS